MGYTHYWEQKEVPTPAQWDDICAQFRKALEPVRGLVWGLDYDDRTSEPVIDGDRIAFNGGHETMCVEREEEVGRYANGDPRTPFAFCKTAYKEYDVLVVALLIIMHHHAPGCWEISSDGDPSDWEEGRELARSSTGVKMKIPNIEKE